MESLSNANLVLINNNNYYVSGPAAVLGSVGGLDRTTLAAWQASTGQDANSIAANPLFNTPTNLQPQTGSPLGAAGAVTPTTTDITGAIRGNPPTIGACSCLARIIEQAPPSFPDCQL